MHNLLIGLLKDKSFLKRIELFKYLYSGAPPSTVADIANTLNMSPTTIRNSIQTLNYDLEEFMEITTQSYGKYELYMKKNVSLETIITTLTLEIPEFQIINNIFHNKISSIYDAAEDLMVSRSTLLRIIDHMNKRLKTFQLMIRRDFLKFKGKEEDIRAFMFSFYSLFGSSQIIHKSAERDAKVFVTLAGQTSLEKLRFSYFNITVWLAILKIRWESRCQVEPNQGLVQLLQDNVEFKSFVELFTEFSTKADFPGEMPVSELAWAYISILHCVTYSSMASSDMPIYNYRYNHLDLHPQVLEDTHHIIGKALPSLAPDSFGFLKLEALLINLYLLSRVSHNYEILPEDILHYFQGHYPEIYEKWFTLLSEARFRRSSLTYAHLEHVAVCLTTISASASKEDQHLKLSVVFALQGPVGLDEYIMETSKEVYTRNINVDYFLMEGFFTDSVKGKEIDLVVTNYELYFEQEPDFHIIRMSKFPTDLDWKNFKGALDLLSMEKETLGRRE